MDPTTEPRPPIRTAADARAAIDRVAEMIVDRVDREALAILRAVDAFLDGAVA